MIEIRDQLDPSKSKTLSYDHLNRLVQVAEGVPVIDGGVPIPVEDYAYDEEGNRTSLPLFSKRSQIVVRRWWVYVCL
ncbi:hypothetical protein [Pelagimonas phthalicica]|uniref:hypothetical protein n=1 Tax=Pelagimonas phthalicica TaxID=1037362 RepID=UPI001061C355|nr:hypothetical protein [Pelagimonas phthalicica]